MSPIVAAAFSYSGTKTRSGEMYIEPSCLENNISHVQKIKPTEKRQDFAVDDFHLTKQADVGGRSVLSKNNRSFLEDLSNSNLNINANITFAEKEDSFIDLIDARDVSNGGASPSIINEQFAHRQQNGFSDHYNLISNSSKIDVIKTKQRTALKRNKSLIGVAQKKISKDSPKYKSKRNIPGLLLRNRIEQTLQSDSELYSKEAEKRKVRQLPDLLPCSEVSWNGSEASFCSNRYINRYLKEDNRDYKYGENHQMGVDIVNKLKKLFGISLTNNNEPDRSRKRSGSLFRSDIPVTDASLIKYRKVNNTFPKFVSNTSDDDIELRSNRNRKNSPIFQKPSFSLRSEMAQRLPLQTFEKPRLQKSYFTPQPMPHKVVKNCGYVDDEFSDDEPEIVNGIDIGNIRKPLPTFRIPLHREEGRKCLPKPSSSLFGMASLGLPELNTIQRPIYSQAPIYNALHTCKRLDHDNSLNQAFGNHGNSTCIAPRLITKAKTVSSLPSFNDRDKYAELLQTLAITFDTPRYAPLTSKKVNCSSQKAPQHSSCSERVNSTAHCNVPLPNCSIDLDEDSDECILVKENPRNSRQVKRFSTTTVVDDDPIEVLDLTKSEQAVISQCSKIKDNDIICLNDNDSADEMELPEVAPVNSLKERFELSPHIKKDWLKDFEMKCRKKQEESKKQLLEVKTMVDKRSAERIKAERELLRNMAEISIFDPRIVVIDEFPEPEEDEDQLVELTDQHNALIHRVLRSPPDQVHINKFNLNATTRDLNTLTGKQWLNDEVINFYMNLLTERSEKKNKTHGLPKVYSMNTFFIPRLLEHGFSAVKRWTRKVDIFEKDIIPVPVHVSGVHWCMAIIHLKNKSIKYYDSMGAPNPRVLNALEGYLKEESLDKKKIPFDTSGFVIESVKDVPRQMNGSDCGVFSCMFAEFITRDKAITFSQEHMEYFRHKMIVEIVRGELLQ
ncbi:uncharacterized protein LOC119671920 isoform X2 [Teleopsis dalmanni]|uniref:uncharacterized protein LOC119671920 isoform X2 n=1 Tax=Teleopsis dalmanni TaxID=139649 RepID=UPI0018CE0087|nr:uncharacterized protein LOC119671920 isoform X2 [Teleopsis dalmanni]